MAAIAATAAALPKRQADAEVQLGNGQAGARYLGVRGQSTLNIAGHAATTADALHKDAVRGNAKGLDGGAAVLNHGDIAAIAGRAAFAADAHGAGKPVTAFPPTPPPPPTLCAKIALE